jgi:hypothetical protein
MLNFSWMEDGENYFAGGYELFRNYFRLTEKNGPPQTLEYLKL